MNATPGYRIRSPETWSRARADYRTGFSVGEICARHGLGVSAVRARIRREAWRSDLGSEIDDDGLTSSLADLVAHAWSRLSQAVHAGCSTAALRWARLHDHLLRMAANQAVQDAPDPPPESDPVVRAVVRPDLRPDPHEVHDVRNFSFDAPDVAPDDPTLVHRPTPARARSP